MSSGSLPLAAYHRAQSLGSGTYGSVVTVYDDDGIEFALKLFLDDKDDDEEIGLSLGALREISILRLLRQDNAHRNVIAIHDVQTGFSDDADDTGAGTGGCLSMAMAMFPEGSMMDALPKIQNKAQKIRIAHGLLSAVAYLHENAILHRDIKSDNILLRRTSDSLLEPVLIDFSLSKIVDPSVIIPGGECMVPKNIMETTTSTHTPSIGTPTYRAPEVANGEGYSFPSDLWSMGVCLLELLRGRELEVHKDKGALALIRDCLKDLPKDQPFPNLIRGLLETDPSERLTARQALDSPVFQKYGLQIDPKTFTRINIHTALPLENQDDRDASVRIEEQKENATPAKGNKKRSTKERKKRADPVLSKRFHRITKICRAMEWDNPLTAQAALTYSMQMSELCDLDDPDDQGLLDCIVLAQKFFEPALTDLSDLNESYAAFENWDPEEFADNEGTLFMMMDFCLYPRQYIEL